MKWVSLKNLILADHGVLPSLNSTCE